MVRLPRQAPVCQISHNLTGGFPAVDCRVLRQLTGNKKPALLRVSCGCGLLGYKFVFLGFAVFIDFADANLLANFGKFVVSIMADLPT